MLMVANALAAFGVLATMATAAEPEYVLKGKDILPKDFPVTQGQILEMTVPDYEVKLKKSLEQLANSRDDMAWWHTYEAAVMAYRRTNLGIEGEDFAVVAILEIEEPCRACRYAIFGVIDLKRRLSVGSFRSEEPALPDNDAIGLTKRGRPWQLTFRYSFGSSNATCGDEWHRDASVVKSTAGKWELDVQPVVGRFVGKCE